MNRKKFTRIGLLLTTMMLLLQPFTSFATDVKISSELSGYSVEQLLDLRTQVDNRLIELGYNPFYDIERGNSGEAVSNIQIRLVELGYYTGKINGKYDTETQKSFKRFEKANRLKNDGIASREDQLVLFSEQAIVQKTATPKPKPTLEPIDEKYASYVDIDYEDCLRYPERNRNLQVKLQGKVLQVLGSRASGFQVRLATSGNDNVVYVFINFDPGYNIIENDRLVVYAVMNETITYESTWKVEVTIPSAIAEHITLR